MVEPIEGAKWIVDTERVSLHLPAGTTASVLMWEGSKPKLSDFAQLAANDGLDPSQPFAIDRIDWPTQNPWASWLRFGGFDFFPDGNRAALSTWNGDVWTVTGLNDTLDTLIWQRIATGLNQPLGLKIVGQQIYVVGRDQITRLVDLNADGEIDFYENFNNDTYNSEHFHEPCMDLQTDAAGNFYYMKAARHALPAQHPHHGTLIRVSPDGEQSTVIAYGFRASNGLGIGPGPTFYGTDQEGYWMPANRLNRITPGGFHGNLWGWYPPGEPPNSYEPPLCWVAPFVDRSPAAPIWIPTGTWGKMGDSLLSLSYGTGKVYAVLQHQTEGTIQGALTELGVELPTGLMRGTIPPDQWGTLSRWSIRLVVQQTRRHRFLPDTHDRCTTPYPQIVPRCQRRLNHRFLRTACTKDRNKSRKTGGYEVGSTAGLNTTVRHSLSVPARRAETYTLSNLQRSPRTVKPFSSIYRA